MSFVRPEVWSAQSILQLCDVIRQTSYHIHEYHRHGHLEKVYENAREKAGQELSPRSARKEGQEG